MTIQDMPSEPTVIAEAVRADGELWRLVWLPAEGPDGPLSEPRLVAEVEMANALGERVFFVDHSRGYDAFWSSHPLYALIVALYSRVRTTRRALVEIADHPHAVDGYDGAGHDGSYGDPALIAGLVEGHQCAAAIARAALEAAP